MERMEKIKTTIALFRDTTDGADLSKLCEELINVINEAGDDKDLLPGNIQQVICLVRDRSHIIM